MRLYQMSRNQPIEEFLFNNMLLNPALTSIDGTNPGFSLFDFDKDKEVVHSLEMHYMRVGMTYNWTDVPEITDPRY